MTCRLWEWRRVRSSWRGHPQLVGGGCVRTSCTPVRSVVPAVYFFVPGCIVLVYREDGGVDIGMILLFHYTDSVRGLKYQGAGSLCVQKTNT